MWRLLEPIKLVFLNNIILVFGVIVFRWDEITLIMSLFTSVLVSLILLLFSSYRLRASILLLIYIISGPVLFIPSFRGMGLVFGDMPWLQIGLISLAQLLLGLVNIKKLKDEAYSKSSWLSTVGSWGAIILFGSFLLGLFDDILFDGIALEGTASWWDIETIFVAFISAKIFFEAYAFIPKYNKEMRIELEENSPVAFFFFVITVGLVALFVWPYLEIRKSGDEGMKIFGTHIGTTVTQKTELSTQPYTDSNNGFEITPPKLWARTTAMSDGSKVSFHGLSFDYYNRESYWPVIRVFIDGIEDNGGEEDVLLLAQSDLGDLAEESRDFNELGVEEVEIGNVPAAIYKFSCACTEDPKNPTKSISLQLVAYHNNKIYTVGGTILENAWPKHAEALRASLLSLRFL